MIVVGDRDAEFGSKNHILGLVMERQGFGGLNNNGKMLKDFLSFRRLGGKLF